MNRIPRRFRAIDAHNHVRELDGSLDRANAEEVLSAADRLGIERLCVSRPLTTPVPAPEEFRAANDIVLEAMKMSRRFIGFCFVNPGHAREALEEVRRCVLDAGMAGVKLYHQYFISDPALAPLLEHAARERYPVLAHAGYLTDPAARAGQPRLSHAGHFVEAARRFPETVFIQGHIAGGGDWEWNLRALEERPPNLYLDTGGSVADSGIIRRTVSTMGERRVLFATDMSFEESVGRVFEAGLGESRLKRVFRDNLLEILGRRAA